MTRLLLIFNFIFSRAKFIELCQYCLMLASVLSLWFT